MKSKFKQPSVPPTKKRTHIQNDQNELQQGNVNVTEHLHENRIYGPAVLACRVIWRATPPEIQNEMTLPGVLASLEQQVESVKFGDMTPIDAKLFSQATALENLFVRLTERALSQSTMSNIEGFMRLALRAQSQCRATLETLANSKNPTIVYARQANVTTGPQQVNNGTAAPAVTQEIKTAQTQLSPHSRGDHHELLPNTGTSDQACRVDSTLETVGEINRTKVPRG